MVYLLKSSWICIFLTAKMQIRLCMRSLISICVVSFLERYTTSYLLRFWLVLDVVEHTRLGTTWLEILRPQAFTLSLVCITMVLFKEHAFNNKVSDYTSHWLSSHYAVTHMCNKNSHIQGRLPNVVKVIFHTIRNCS